MAARQKQLKPESNPIWIRNPNEITKEEYCAFYKLIANEWEEYLAYKHFSIEGQLDFSGLLFVPKRAPFDMFEIRPNTNNVLLQNIGARTNNKQYLKLYIHGLFIMDDFKELVPEYISSFIHGVVDSYDLPLNLSQRSLQQNKTLKVILKTVVEKTVQMFAEIAENKEDYQIFYDQFSKNIKLGICEDYRNRKKLSELLRYSSTKTTDKEMISLKQYVERMQDAQKVIYYITGVSKTQVEKSPFLEALKKRNLEVLCLVDPIDEYVVQQLRWYDGKELQCVSKERLDLELNEEEKKTQENDRILFGGLCNKMKEILGDKVHKVTISNRMVESPCSLVSGEYGWSANMERIKKAQSLRDSSIDQYMVSKKIMEINPKHPIIFALNGRFSKDSSGETIKDMIFILFEISLLTSGYSLDETVKIAEKMYKLINDNYGLRKSLESKQKENEELKQRLENMMGDEKKNNIQTK